MSQYKVAVLAALKAVKAKGDTEKQGGICHAVLGMIDPSYFKSWPEHSGERDFPVPHEALEPEDAYYECPKWDKATPYGQARWRLLDHLIECYEKELGL